MRRCLTDDAKRAPGRWTKAFVWFAVAVTAYRVVVGAGAWAAGDFSPTPFSGTWTLIPLARLVTYPTGYAPTWLRLAAICTVAAGVVASLVLLQTVDFERRFDLFATVVDALFSAFFLVSLVGLEWHERRRR